MRLQKKKEEELAKRKGLTGKTIIQVIWLAISVAIAFFLTQFLFAGNYVNLQMFYTQLFIPSAVPEWGVKAIMIFGIVVVMQIIFAMGFFIASPEGRRRTGDASLHSRNKDPFDDQFH
jgi:uncharacterized membrane protein YedE/YeeE